MIRDLYKDDMDDYRHHVVAPRIEECAYDAALGMEVTADIPQEVNCEND